MTTATLERPAKTAPPRDAQNDEPSRPAASPGAILALLCAAQFMVVADDTIVNVALPSIRADLGFTQSGLAWVVNAYLLAFGGFLLVGGRAADLFGRRRMFAGGVLAFAAISLICGLAPNAETLTAARALQGLAGAFLSPAALGILLATFPQGDARTKALATWGGIVGIAGASGVLLSGVITEALDWRWVFLVNVPIGIAIAVLAVRRIPAHATRRATGQGMDIPGAVLATGGLVALLYTVVETHAHGWTSARTLGGFALGLALLAGFALHERGTREPLLPLALFRRRAAVVALVVLTLAVAAILAQFFLVTLFMQNVKGWGPLHAGASWLPWSAAMLTVSGVMLKALPGRALRPFIVAGAVVGALGFALLAQLDAADAYVTGLLPAQVLLGAAAGLLLVPTTTAATTGLGERFAGLGSGLLTTFQQFGGAIGIAVFVTIAQDRTAELLRTGGDPRIALAEGFATSFWVGVGLSLAAAAVALGLGRLRASDEIAPAH